VEDSLLLWEDFIVYTLATASVCVCVIIFINYRRCCKIWRI